VIAFSGEYVYFNDDKGILKFSVVNTQETTSFPTSAHEEKVTCLAALCAATEESHFVATGFSSGKTEIRDTRCLKTSHCLRPKNSETPSAVTAVAYQGNLLAVGTENGTLAVWGDPKTAIGEKKTALELLEISKFSVYMPGSFSRRSIIMDAFSFKADSRGGLFVNQPSYSLEIPQGAVRDGESIEI
jgi:WD40 repeat protein